MKQLDITTTDEARAKRRKALRAKFRDPSVDFDRLVHSPAVKEIVQEWGKQNYKHAKKLLVGSINYLTLFLMVVAAVGMYFATTYFSRT
jgi:hypothetical protein